MNVRLRRSDDTMFKTFCWALLVLICVGRFVAGVVMTACHRLKDSRAVTILVTP